MTGPSLWIAVAIMAEISLSFFLFSPRFYDKRNNESLSFPLFRLIGAADRVILFPASGRERFIICFLSFPFHIA